MCYWREDWGEVFFKNSKVSFGPTFSINCFCKISMHTVLLVNTSVVILSFKYAEKLKSQEPPKYLKGAYAFSLYESMVMNYNYKDY